MKTDAGKHCITTPFESEVLRDQSHSKCRENTNGLYNKPMQFSIELVCGIVLLIILVILSKFDVVYQH